MSEKNWTLIFGGASTEFDASVASFHNVVSQLSPEMREGLHAVFIPRTGGGEFALVPMEQCSSDETILNALPRQPLAELVAVVGQAFMFVLLHGAGSGEDGTWAGFCALTGIASSSWQVLQGALTMSKWACSPVVDSLMAGTGLRVPQTLVIRSASDIPPTSPFLRNEIVVKPAELGASQLTSLLPCWDRKTVESLCAEIHRYSDVALVQERIVGRELSVGLLERDGEMIALPVMEIETPTAFFSHSLKHSVGAIETIVDDAEARQVQGLAKMIAERLGLRGWARVDFLVDTQGPVFLEVNSIPGLMVKSLYPAMLDAAGLSIDDLVDALMRVESNARLNRVFRYEVA